MSSELVFVGGGGGADAFSQKLNWGHWAGENRPEL